jgi:hypothetical protein
VIDAASYGLSGPMLYPVPYKQNQDRADDRGYQRANEANHRNIQETGKYPAHKRPGYADEDICKNTMIRLSYLFCDPSGDRSDYQHRKEAYFRMTKKRLRVFHRTLHIPVPTRPQMPMSSTSLGAEEAVKHVLNIIDMFLFDVLASLEVVAEDRRACTAHHA